MPLLSQIRSLSSQSDSDAILNTITHLNNVLLSYFLVLSCRSETAWSYTHNIFNKALSLSNDLYSVG